MINEKAITDFIYREAELLDTMQVGELARSVSP
jgi:3-phenylpropionate/cinnamic acid dioxygenase small subunit